MMDPRQLDPGERGPSGADGGRSPPPSRLADRGEGMSDWLRRAGDEGDVVLSSRVRLARNLAGFPLMPRASRADRAQILEICRRTILPDDGPERGGDPAEREPGPALAFVGGRIRWVPLHRIERVERELLIERHLISKQHASGRLSDGTGDADEPRAVAIGVPGERLAIMVNEEDHLRIQMLRPGLCLGEALGEIDAIDDGLESVLDFSFSPRFGYLTACPTNVGTGLRLSVMLHLPGLRLTGEIDKVKRAADDMSLAVRGFYGEGSQVAGDLYQLSNQTTLGKSESVLLHEMEQEIIPRIIDYERDARESLLSARRVTLEDKVWRAVGCLREARLMSADEAMERLSLLRLGVAVGMIDPSVADAEELGRLSLLIQPAHLQVHFAHRELSQVDRRIERAAMLRARLGGRVGGAGGADGHGRTG